MISVHSKTSYVPRSSFKLRTIKEVKKKVPRNYWSNLQNQREALDKLFKHFGYNKPEDWYNITKRILEEHGAGGFMSKYYFSSPSLAVRTVYPEYFLQDWRFSQVPSNYWSNLANQREFFDHLTTVLEIRKPSDWYNVTRQDLLKVGACGLLQGRYRDSPFRAIMSIYPEYNWHDWKFAHVPTGYWRNVSHQTAFIRYMADKYEISQPSEWKRVTYQAVNENGGSGILEHFGSFVKALSILGFISDSQSQSKRLVNSNKKSVQHQLVSIMREVFSNTQFFLSPESLRNLTS